MSHTETSLAASIDRLARRRAEEFLVEIEQAIKKSLEKKWRSDNGHGYYRGEDIDNVLRHMAAPRDDRKSVKPTDGLVNNIRCEIIDKMLKSLPAMEQIIRMQNEEAEEAMELLKRFDQ